MIKVQLRVLLLCLASAAVPACGASQKPAPIAMSPSHGPRTGPLRLDTSTGHLTVNVLAPGVVHVRFTRNAATSVPASFAVDPEAQQPSAPYTLEERAAAVFLRTAALGLRITRQPLSVALLGPRDRVLREQAAPLAWSEHGVTGSWRLAEGERVYGLGDKAKGFDRRGQSFELWNSDAYGFKPDSDPLYKSIPFFVFMNAGQAHGLFVDSPSRAQLDIGKTVQGTFSYAAEAGDALDLYLFAGPDPKRVLESYTALTGRTPLPPRWALGYHQSRYSYATEEDARAVAARLRADHIPTDALWLDIDYQQGHAPFTVDAKAFPHFENMLADWQRAALRAVLITDPHPKSYQGNPLPSGYAPYDSGAAGDHFLHDAQGGFVTEKVWPGLSVFPEFTLTRTRRWWGDLYQSFVAQGVAGFWNDMNEPAAFNETKTLPVFVRHRMDDGSTLDHTFVHNAYGGLNARATFEGLRRLRPNVRPFVLTRAAYAGTQRYAATWTGDNSATREHLALSIAQLANLGVSGYAFAGVDVGGFVGCPDPELLAEWTEVAALQPFFRNHSDNEACRREPWLHGAANEARIRSAIERRYRLLPYLYSVFEESARTGLPVLRPLWLEYPNDDSVRNDASTFMLGADLLVAPKLVEGNVSYEVQLPRAGWFDTVTEALIPDGGKQRIPASADSVRLFARAGAIIAQQPVTQFADQPPPGPLEVDVWPGARCSGSLYLDDGQSFAYETGAFRRVSFSCQAGEPGIVVSAASSGSFPPWWQATTLRVHGVARPPVAVVDGGGAALAHEYDAKRRLATVHLSGPSADWSARLTL